MKYIVILCAIAVGYYFYSSSTVNTAKGSINDRISSGEAVPASDIQKEAKNMLNFFCSDNEVQKSFGSSSAECMKTFKNNETSCDSKVFPNPDAVITSGDQAKTLISRYRKCTIS